MSLEKTSSGTTLEIKRPESSEVTPKTNEEAKKRAGKETKVAKAEGKKRVELAKKGKEKKEKAQRIILTVCGKKIERKTSKGKVVFFEKGKTIPIENLGSWIEIQMANTDLQQQINKHLRPFLSKVKSLDTNKRKKLVRKLNSTSFSNIESGKIDIHGQKIDDPIKKAAYLASIVSSKVGQMLIISAEVLKTLKCKDYLDYQHILPANVRTIVVTRNNKKIVCSRAVDPPQKGGRVSYIDLVTGKRIYLKNGDKVRIVGALSTSGSEYKNIVKAEQSYTNVRVKAGKTWRKNSDTPVSSNGNTVNSRRVSSYALPRASSGGGVVLPHLPSLSSRTRYSDKVKVSPAHTPRTRAHTPRVRASVSGEVVSTISSFKETPEVMKQNCIQETFKLPENHMFSSMLSPNLKKYPKLKEKNTKPKLIIYFAGRGYYKAIQEWVAQHGRKQEPPLDVLAKAAREDFLSSQKRIFSMLKSRWEKGENVHLALVSHMRSYLHPTDSGASKYWYRELWNKDSANAVFGSVVSKFKDKSGAKSIGNINLVGHSMGGKALAGLSRLNLLYNFSYFYSDATYWAPKLDSIKRNPKSSLYISYRKGTKTEKIARRIIEKLHLKGTKRGKEILFSNSKYPNVKVVENSISHSSNVGRYLKPAWELAQKAQTGKLRTVA